MTKDTVRRISRSSVVKALTLAGATVLAGSPVVTTGCTSLQDIADNMADFYAVRRPSHALR